MFLVMEVMLLAKKMGRTLVLPHLHSQPMDNTKSESGVVPREEFTFGTFYIPMENFFQMEEIKKYVDAITLDEFLKIKGKHLSVLCCFDNPHKDEIRSYGINFKFKKAMMMQNAKELKKLEEESVALTGFDHRHFINSSPNWPKILKDDYWKIRRRLIFNKKLLSKAEDFMNKKGLHNYVSVHWRRGDRVLPEINLLQEIITENKESMKKMIDKCLVFPLKKIMKKEDLEKVFLATNSGTKWHVDYLKSKLPIIQYPSSGNWRKREEESIIENIICSKAEYFLGAPFKYEHCSSFSRWIIDCMILRGLEHKVEHQKKMGDTFLAKDYRKYLTLRKKVKRLIYPFHPFWS